MKTLLLYPPISDPTSGYHSLCYLETYARKHGFENIDILDTNIEALLYTMRPDQVCAIKKQIETKRYELENKLALNAMEQLELFHLWKSDHFDYENLPNAIQAMRDEELFYDYTIYRPAAELLTNWLDVLSVFGYPGQFQGYSLPLRYTFNLNSSQDMSDYDVVNRIAAPFEPYFRQVLLPYIAQNQFRTVGINITYCSQLPFALAISRLIRSEFPEIMILFGGTEVSDVWKYLIDKKRFFNVFNAADACVIGEGEVAFTKLLEMIKNDQPFEPIPNVLFHDKYDLSTMEPQIEFGRIFDLPTPDYSKLPMHLYLSPHPYVYYSPSRGCYWNKCTFCDYGLNFDSPTSPWRQNPIEKIVEDIKEITSHSIKHIYFSVDVLAPAMLLNLAEKIVESNLNVRWGAEIRLEQYWSPERCSLLKVSGCTDISVGYESGNQRILNLIDKGTQVQRVSETIYNFSQANIGVQIMGFTGFPTETFEEAMDSVQFLTEHHEHWTFGGLGNFVLTPGSIVAKEPERFNLSNVRPLTNEDIVRDLYFEDPLANRTPENKELLNQAKAKLDKHHFNRPWVGGVDTAHTMFYHERYGNHIVNIVSPVHTEFEIEQTWYLNGKIAYDSKYYPIEQLFKDKDVFKLHSQARESVNGLVSDQIEIFVTDKITSRQDMQINTRYFIRNDGTFYPFPDAMIEFLSAFESGRSLHELLSSISESDHQGVKQMVEHCVTHHFLRNRKHINSNPVTTSRKTELISYE